MYLINLCNELTYIILHYTKEIYSLNQLLNNKKYELTKVYPFDVIFRVEKTFLEQSFKNGVLYELFSIPKIHELLSIESKIIYDENEMLTTGYSDGKVDEFNPRKITESMLERRIQYLAILSELLDECNKKHKSPLKISVRKVE